MHDVMARADALAIGKHLLENMPGVVPLAGMDGEELRLKLHAHGMHAEYAHVCAIEPFGEQFDKRGRARLTVRAQIEGGAAELEGRFVALAKG